MDSHTSTRSFMVDEITITSGSKRSFTSHQSKSSVGSINGVEFESKSTANGSRREDSFATSRREINDEDARMVYLNDPEKTNGTRLFARNTIRTGKYSLITFLPRNLFEQFHRVAYIYFLIIAVLNQLPQLAVFGRGASVLPLAFVLVVTAVKDAYEDWRRHRSDKLENNRLALVMVNNKFVNKKWKDIQVGEIIRIHADESIPCDMVLLSTSDSTGVAYVQTLNLDGESNLKTRYAKQETLIRDIENEPFHGSMKCEKPNRNVYDFHATMQVDERTLSLGASNIILRGCELKNTAWVIGVAVYCGQETKALLNSSGSPSKRSRLETQMNREIIIMSFFLIILCTIVSCGAVVWLNRHMDHLSTIPFYRKTDFNEEKPEKYNYYGVGFEYFFTFLMSVIVFQIMIPISLYISMELVRVGQAYFMIRDTRMYDESSNSRFQCRALNINEDLGQIKFVFSDKTGTLTENKMEFQRASIWGEDYSDGNEESWVEDVNKNVEVNGVTLVPKMKVKIDPRLLKLLRNGKHSEEQEHIHNFFLALAACNTIVPLHVDTADPNVKLLEYQGESPDEQALAYAAASYGFTLIERTSGHLVIDIQGLKQRFNVLGLHEFDSERKRMSVILGCPDESMKVFVKGADNAMFNVIDASLNMSVVQKTEAHLNSYATKGLRTLVVGMRELNDLDFELWHSAFEKASAAFIGRAAMLLKVANQLEHNLLILGASGIEDKLQRGVPEAIEALRAARIKVWVLTGDKQETAISIGNSSKLLTPSMTNIIINSHSVESCRRSLIDGLATCEKIISISGSTAYTNEACGIALIIDGTSLVHILDSELEEQLFELSTKCATVLCCRVAPLQKAGIVALVRSRTPDMTLAIGDGANDVSMIQTAHVGVGISGQEGRQAVMASDFAMGQFRFLVPLLLVHGHWNYQRMAYMLNYNFYRNAVFVLILFWYELFTAYTPTTAINEWSSMLYSIIYTSLPTIVVAVLDKDLKRSTLLRNPQHYKSGQTQESYNPKLFWLAIADTVWQSVVAFYIPYFAYRISDVDAPSIGDLWTLAAVILVNLHLAMDVVRWNWIIHLVIWGSIAATVSCIIVIDAIPSLVGYWAIFHAIRSSRFWLCLLSIVVTALVPRLVVKVVYHYYWPDDIQIAKEIEKYGSETHGEVELNPLEPR